MLLNGACHCGQVRVSFETGLPLDEIEVRACQCSFCRSHGAKTVTDPNGSLTISAPSGALTRYRFGLKITDYLLCNKCGAYIAAIMSDGAKEIATLNAAGTMLDGLWEREAKPVHLEGEAAEARRERRRRGWTPAKVVTAAARRHG
jgi:hypothetical protein